MAKIFGSEKGVEEVGVARVQQSEALLGQLYRDEEVVPTFRVPRLRALKLFLVTSFIAFSLFGGTMLFKFNNFIVLREDVRAKQGNLDSAIQRRANLVNNLVKLTLSHAALEHSIFFHVADMRTRIAGQADKTAGAADEERREGTTKATENENGDATQDPSLDDNTKKGKGGAKSANGGAAVEGEDPRAPKWLEPLVGMADNGMAASLSRLLAVVEQYPTVRSSETYLSLIQSLVEVEDQIAQRREQHHQALLHYNSAISNFPWHWLAQVTKFSRADYFEAEASVRVPPVITSGLYQQLAPLSSGGEGQP